jgi:penicillin-binding protein 1A
MIGSRKLNKKVSSYKYKNEKGLKRILRYILAVFIIAGRLFKKLFRAIGDGFSRFAEFLGGLFKNPVIRSEKAKSGKHEADGPELFISTEDEHFKKQVRPGPEDSTMVIPSGKHRRKEEYPVVSPDHLMGDTREHVSIFKPREKRPNFAIGVVLTTVKMLVLVIFMFGSGLMGLLWGVAKAYMETTPKLDVNKIENQAVNSYIYDADDKLITVFTGTENREWASLKDIPMNLQNAFISVEDIRFRYHNGIDIKRIFGVFVSNILNENVQGGSTITQQLIKNRLLSTEQTYKRKIQEAYLSMQLEDAYTKDEILEGYLNTIPLGGTNYGVKAAAKDFFNKDLKDLTLRECACLAGMNQAPYKYNPRRVYYTTKDPKPLNDRVDFVLKKMYEADFITKAQYDQALADQLSVVEKSSVSELYSYPYFVEYAINDVITHLLEKRNLQDTKTNRSEIENEIRTQGYQIYTTLDPKMQDTVQNTLANYKKYPKLENSKDAVTRVANSDGSILEVKQPQAAMVIFDYHTGELKAIIGGREAPVVKKSMNRAYQTSMPVGSSIKPIAVYGPAIDKGYSPGSVIANVPVKIKGWNTDKGYPATASSTYGPLTLRKGLVKSLNIATARTLMDYVGINDSKQYLVELGVDPSHINADGPGLALGTSGITPVEMAGAYGAVANKGVYQEPLSFRYVKDRNGNVILDANEIREKRQVFKESTAWMLTDMLENAVMPGKGGTGTRAYISKDMPVGGKTGTNQDNRGVFFAGITPYYAATLWIGHDNFKKLDSDIAASTTAAPLWKDVMSKVLKGKPGKPIIEGKPESFGLVKVKVCSVSGMKATAACEQDIDGHKPVEDWFVAGTEPTEECDWHQTVEICKDTNLIATQYCVNKKTVSLVFPPASSPLSSWNKLNGGIKFPSADPLDPENAPYICNVHTEEWYNANKARPEAITKAQQTIQSVNANIATYVLMITAEQKTALENAVGQLQALIDSPASTATEIETQTAALQQLANSIFSSQTG